MGLALDAIEPRVFPAALELFKSGMKRYQVAGKIYKQFGKWLDVPESELNTAMIDLSISGAEEYYINRFIFDRENINNRFNLVIKMAWEIFQCKVGNGLIDIYKEASMQLQFAYILQNLIPVFIYEKDENVEIELEKTVAYNGKTREIDIFVVIHKGNNKPHNIAIEMKCYKEQASSGGKRGATDIFMKDVYVDLEKLENYKSNDICQDTLLLVMTDLERLVSPKNKEAKCWDYDISDGFILSPKTLSTPIGGKEDISIKINNEYLFKWTKADKYYFLIL